MLPTGRSQGISDRLAGPTPTLIPTPIVPNKPVYTVQRGDVVRRIQFVGRVAPLLEEELFFRSNGRIRNVFVKRDDFVTAGQLIAELEIDDLERELTSTQLDLERAEQQLAQAEQQRQDNLAKAKLKLNMAVSSLKEADQNRLDDMTKAKIDLTIKQIELTKAENQDPAPREAVAATDLVRARIALKKAQEAYDEIAFADDIGSSDQAIALEQATLDFQRAQAAYDLALEDIDTHDYDLELLRQEIAQAQLEVTRLGENESSQLELAVAMAQLDVDILDRELDPLFKNNVDRAKLDVQKLEAEIADAQIVAPFDGQILSITLIKGREGEAFKPVVVIADPSELDIRAEPQDTQLSELAENMPVVVGFSTRPDEEYLGYIRQLPYPYGGGSGTVEGLEEEDTSTHISLEVTPSEAGLKLGDLMQIEVIVEKKTDVLWLPPQAIRTFEARRFVVVQQGEAQQRFDVKIGLESEDRVEIEEGLTEGQVVIGP